MDQAAGQRLQVMAELEVVAGRYALVVVVVLLEFDGPPAPVGGRAPLADPHGEVGLHVEGMGNAGR